MNNIRTARFEDLDSIIEIYNQAVKNRFETADINEVELKDKIEWFLNHHPETYPIFVYENNENILGWISLSPYRKGRMALRYTIEISYYVHKEYKRQGIGSKLIEYSMLQSRKIGYRTLFAIILDKNEASMNLLYKFGFTKWGHMPNIADFNGEECGHVYLGYKL